MLALRLIVSGRVQGVFFRDWTVRAARAAGLAGWVRNLADGRVEVQVAGAADAVERFVAALAQGPERARVDAVTRDATDGSTLPHPFERRATG